MARSACRQSMVTSRLVWHFTAEHRPLSDGGRAEFCLSSNFALFISLTRIKSTGRGVVTYFKKTGSSWSNSGVCKYHAVFFIFLRCLWETWARRAALLVGRVSSLSAILWRQETEKTRSRQVAADQSKQQQTVRFSLFGILYVWSSEV